MKVLKILASCAVSVAAAAVMCTFGAVDSAALSCPEQADITKMYYELGIDPNLQTEYSTMYSATDPYSAGKLSGTTLQNALKYVKFIRYTAGLPTDLVLVDEYNSYAQAASLVNYMNNNISHFPSQPVGLPDDLYKKGYDGAGRSNLGFGYSNLIEMTKGWLGDADTSNIDRVGHRRWLLGPELNRIGFGQVGSSYATYVFGGNGTYSVSDYVCWPPENMPYMLYTPNGNVYPFSVSLGSKYRMPVLSDLRVTVTSEKLGKSWQLDSSSNNKSGEYLTVENSYYSSMNKCIIFNTAAFPVNDKVHVTINGVKLTDGTDTVIDYDVNFFKLGHLKAATAAYTSVDGDSVPVEAAGRSATVLVYGKTTCGNCDAVMTGLADSVLSDSDKIKVMFIDTIRSDKDTVAAFAESHGGKNISYCYDTGSTANNDMWCYAHQKSPSGSVTFPVIVMIDGKGAVQSITTGYQTTTDIIKTLISECDVSYSALGLAEEGVEVTDWGMIGNKGIWTLDADGVLRINGSGNISASYYGLYLTDSQKQLVRKVIVGRGVTELGYNVFSGFTAVEEIVIPDTLVSVGYGAFSGCSALKEISLPVSIESIGSYAFEDCTALKDINYPGSRTQWYSISRSSSVLPAGCKVNYYYGVENPVIASGTTLPVSDAKDILYYSDKYDISGTLTLETEVINTELSGADVAAVKTAAGSRIIGKALNVTLVKYDDGTEKGTVTTTTKPITVTIPLPDDLKKASAGKVRDFIVISVSNGTAALLNTEYDGKNISFSTNLFGDYAITYIDLDYGDVNGDGAINMADLLLLKQYMVKVPGKSVYKSAADVTADNNLRMKQFMVKVPGVTLGK